MLTRWRDFVTAELTRLRTGGRSALLWSLRITVAATLSFVVATLIFPDRTPLLAPLTAMLVVQVTPVSLLASGIERVIAVVAGVSVAVVFASAVPLTWWSLGALIFISITLGQVLRLQSNLVEVAISAMLVLGVGFLGAEAAAWQRIAETLVGAAVGIAANLLFPPKVASEDAGDAIDGLADRISELLATAGRELAEHRGPEPPPARPWLDEARMITYDIPRIGLALIQAEEGRRLNVRAVGTADVGPGLRQGLEALEHTAVSLRGLFRAVYDATGEPAWRTAGPATEDVLAGVAQTLTELSAAVDAFGKLVHDEGDPNVRMGGDDAEAVRTALDGIHEARARLEDALVSGGPPVLVELTASVLGTVKRVEAELDLDERVRRQLRLSKRGRSEDGSWVVDPSGTDGIGEVDVQAPTQPDPDAETQPMRMPKSRREP